MKHLAKPAVLSGICAGAGLICLCLRQWLLTAGEDSRGLLVIAHPGNILSWSLCVLVLATLCLSLLGKGSYRFQLSPLSAVGNIFCIVGYFSAAWTMFSLRGQTLSAVCGVLAVVCALCALLQALGQFQGKRVQTIFYCPSVIFYMCFLVCRYQLWSGEAQPQRYFFPMMAAICLMLSTYRRAAAAAAKRKGWDYLLLSRAAIFLCLAAIPDPDFGVFFGTMAVSVLLDGCTLKAPTAGA